jgi:hypothetical protein
VPWGEVTSPGTGLVLYSLGESGSNTGLVAFDKKVSAEILVERAVLEHVVGGRQQ